MVYHNVSLLIKHLGYVFITVKRQLIKRIIPFNRHADKIPILFDRTKMPRGEGVAADSQEKTVGKRAAVG